MRPERVARTERISEPLDLIESGNIVDDDVVLQVTVAIVGTETFPQHLMALEANHQRSHQRGSVLVPIRWHIQIVHEMELAGCADDNIQHKRVSSPGFVDHQILMIDEPPTRPEVLPEGRYAGLHRLDPRHRRPRR